MHIYISKLLKKGIAAMILGVNAPSIVSKGIATMVLGVNAPSIISRCNLLAPVYSVESFPTWI